ncbi:hypothetical protein Hdeb2414_s0010g00330721 [Helianthus debilis subsp. tardiflorus]
MGQSLPFERIAWLKVIGVLIHLAVDEVYNSIAGRFGKVIHASQRSSEDCDLSVNCIGVLVGDGVRIVELITLKWKDKMFKVWVEEELADWIPDCLEPAESSEEDELSSQFRCDDLENDPSLQRVETKEGSNDVSRLEVQVSPSVHEEGEGSRLHVENIGNEGNNFGGDFGNDERVSNEAVDAQLKDNGGTQFMPKTVNPQINNNFFFTSSELGNRPKKRSFFLLSSGTISPDGWLTRAQILMLDPGSV